MKNYKKFTLGFIGAAILATGLWACNNDDITKETEQNQTYMTVNTVNAGIASMYIDNGIASESSSNILVFDSKQILEETIDQMTQQYDDYNETLDEQIPADLTDDELEDYINAHNLNEDYTLDNFEMNLGFKSLRKIIHEKELIWLETQGEQMDINTDPDNHFIVSDFERTLLNEGSEIIIKDENNVPVIHKYFEWGHIEILDFNTEVLKEINIQQISDPQVLENYSSKIKIFDKNKDGLIITGCRKSGKSVNYYYFDNRQIKAFTSQNVGLFDKTLVAKTKGYRWKKGKWKNAKLWIHAGVTGLNRGNWKVHHQCADEIVGAPHWKDEKRYKLEYRLKNPNPISMYARNNNVYSYHSEGGTSFFVDYYDYQAIQW